MPSRYSRYYDPDTRNRDNDSYARRDGRGDFSMVRRARTQDFDGPSGYGSDVNYGGRRSRRQEQYGDEPVYNLAPRRNRSAGSRERYHYSRQSRSRRESATDDSGFAYGYANGRGPRRDRTERDSGRNQSRGQDQQRTQQEQQRTQQEQQRPQQEQQQRNQTQGDSRDGTEEQDFMSRHFDRGPDGLITGAAGAALGAISARHFLGPKEFTQEADSKQGRIRKNWKTILGAAVGALAANAVENRAKTYFEEQEADERKEHIETGGEFAGEVMAAVGPDVL